MATTVTQVIETIGNDILTVLKVKGEPMTEHEMYLNSKLKNTSEYGWRFAIRDLEKKGLIEGKGIKYTLTKKGRTHTK